MPTMKTPFARAALALLALALAGAVGAQPASTDPNTVQAGTYNVEPQHTRILFSVLHLGFTHYYGAFTGTSGTLTLDPNNIGAAQVQVTFSTTSVSTTNQKLDGELKDVPWLDATAFPKATFVSRKVTRTGPKTARIEGDLTLRGITRPVVLDATFNAAGMNPLTHKYTVGFDAIGHLNRSDFKVSAFIPAISDNVDIIISAAFEKAG
jgi:polyisoprenoid-binding protein YceI